MPRILASLSVLIVSLSLLAARSANDASGASGTGGTISFDSPQVNGTAVTIPINTSAPLDPYFAWNIHVRWDPTVLSYGSFVFATGCGPTAGPTGGPAVDGDGGGAVMGCTRYPGDASFNPGPVGTLNLTATGSGCSTVHLVTYGGSDVGNAVTGTYSLSAGDLAPQSNAYGSDVTVDFGGPCHPTGPGGPPCISSPSIYDVNGDGVVDTPDLALIGVALGSTPASPNWNPAADVIVDGRVNMADLAKDYQHFTQQSAGQCPPITPTEGPPSPTATATPTPTSTPTPSCPPLLGGDYLGAWRSTAFPGGGGTLSAKIAFVDTHASGWWTLSNSQLPPQMPITSDVTCNSATFATAPYTITGVATLSADGKSYDGTYSGFGDEGVFSLSLQGADFAQAPVTAADGGVIGTGAAPTGTDSTVTQISFPAGATASDFVTTILEAPAVGVPTGFSALGQQVSIDTGGATFSPPASLLLLYDASITGGISAASMLIFRNGVLVPDCGGAVPPYPCVSGRTTVLGDIQVSVLATAFSQWQAGIASLSVGGVAEQSDVTAAPSAAAASGRDYAAYILGAAVAFLAVGAGAVRWRKRRTLAAGTTRLAR